MRISAPASTALAALAPLGALALGLVLLAAPAAQAREELGASGTRLSIAGGAPRFYMTYGHAEDPELFAPITRELARLQLVFRREGNAYGVYFRGQKVGEPWPVLTSRDGAPETGDEPFVLYLGGSVYVPVRKIAELFPIDVKWSKRDNLLTLVADPGRAVAAAPRRPGAAPPAAAGASAILSRVELAEEGGEVKVRVRGSERVMPTTLTLKSPPRIVLDFPGARWAEGLTLPPGAGDVRLVRMGYFTSPTNPDVVAARLVLELSTPVARLTGLDLDDAETLASVGRSNRSPVVRAGTTQISGALARRAGAGPRRMSSRGGLDLPEVPGAPSRLPPVPSVRAGATLAGRVICLDAGHGGHSSGARGLNNLEKDLCLRMALELKRELEARGARVVMTRDTDVFVGLDERCQIANSTGSEIFISIHLNSTPTRNSASGTETYWHTAQSFPLAQALHQRMLSVVGKPDRGIRNRGFYVVRNTTMPSVLLEVAFINNEQDELLLATPELHANLAVALAEGVVDYFEQR